MNKDTPEEAEWRAEQHRAAAEAEKQDSEDEATGYDRYPSETIHAVPVDEVTCGIDVTLFEPDDGVFAPAVRIEENWPPEDDREAESVMIHGGHALMQVIAAMSYLFAERFDEDPWPET